MKRFIGAVLALTLLCSMVSCASANTAQSNTTRRPSKNQTDSVPSTESEQSSQPQSSQLESSSMVSSAAASSTPVSSVIPSSALATSSVLSQAPQSQPSSLAASSAAQSSAVTSSQLIPDVNAYEQLTVNATDLYTLGYLKIDGRFDMVKTKFGKPKDSITMDNTAQCLAVNLDCVGDVTMDYEITAQNSNGKTEYARCYLRVFVDGEDQGRVRIDGTMGSEDTGTVTLAKGLSKGKHEIKIYKATESKHILLNVINLSFSGVPTEKPKDSEIYIEFMGDSYTAGFGSLIEPNVNPSNPDAPERSDGTVTYAAHTAAHFGADYATVCASGMGFLSGLYGYTAEEYLSKICPYRGDAAYDYSTARQPDVFVICLGANDNGKGYTPEQLTEGAAALCNAVKTVYPNTKIVWFSNSGIGKNEQAIQKGVESVGAIYCDCEVPDEGGGHPREYAHSQMAQQLIQTIEDNNLL